MAARFARAVRVFLLTSLLAGAACGGTGSQRQASASEQPAITAAATGALVGAERTHAARAAHWASEAARYRKVAVRQRELAAADAQRTLPTPAAVQRIASRKATAESRAASADQVAARLQPIIDFHTAEAAKEATR